MLLTSGSAAALTVEFVGPCSETPLFAAESTVVYSTVGAATVAMLNAHQVVFVGGEYGIQSIFDTPVGLDAMEVISDSEMRAYGWCFNVDGVFPEVMADEVNLYQGVQKIQWIFSYADYLSGQWTTQCRPSYAIKPDFLCKDQ